MKTLTVELGKRSYPIYIGSGVLNNLAEKLKDYKITSKCAIVSNPTVYELYGEPLYNCLSEAGMNIAVVLIPDGEEYKDLFWAYYILTQLLEEGLDRGSVLFALGGGVIGDITGFVASTYMRGISYVQIPTTLLSQVDSSVGGKTGVNHPLGKNMIGTFYQPMLVWIDVQTLKSLPEREFLAGLAEVIKYGVIWDKDFFEFLRDQREAVLTQDEDILIEVIRRCCEIKAEVVSQDERESGLRAILNFGHTIGHAIETVTNYRKYLHGEAVAIGMVAEALLSDKMSLLETEEAEMIKEVVASYGLPTSTGGSVEPSQMLKAMSLDKKAKGGRIRIILPQRIGRVRIEESIEVEKLTEVLSTI
jgi:3-dehydroquinate synthase